MAKKEPPMMQQLGPKKYYEKVDKAAKFYDQHKAGKRDPKTGEFYHNISFTAPKAPTKVGQTLGEIECNGCKRPLTIRTSTICVSCSNCACFHRIKYNRDSGEIAIEATPAKKP